MFLLRWLTVFAFLLFSSAVYAQGNIELSEDIRDEVLDDVQELPKDTQIDTSNLLDEDTYSDIDSDETAILSNISSVIGEYAHKNIIGAEQVFCYQIATPPENYSGYTLDGMAIVGFCGVIDGNLRKKIVSELMNNPEHIIFDHFEDCPVRPQIMLRFMRGVDATDVLLSYPCSALAFFYSGRISTFNAKPAATVIDNFVRALLKNKIEFVSPTLFNQLLPAGVAKTDEQKAIWQKANQPFKRWEQQKQEQKDKSSGWNKLKNR